MKLIVKTLNGKQLPIEIESDTTIGQIKQKIEADHQLKAESLKLIAYGKVLQSDDQKASEYNLKEGDFIVAMVQKAKPPPKKPAEQPKEDKPKPEENKEEEKPATNPPASNPPAATGASGAGASAGSSAAAQQQLPPEVEQALAELMAISGKPRELCIQALQAANNIPDLAFELLLSGNIPDQPMEMDGADDMGDDDSEMMGGVGGGLAQYNLPPETLEAIQALSNNPSFPMIRQRMLQDPNFSQ